MNGKLMPAKFDPPPAHPITSYPGTADGRQHDDPGGPDGAPPTPALTALPGLRCFTE